MVVKMEASSSRPDTLDWYGFCPTVTESMC